MSVKEATEHYSQHEDGTEMRSRLSEMKPAIFPDSVHDEAVRVITQYSGDQEWGEIEEKRLVRKIDRKLMPLMFLTYGLQYYDKAMLSQAAIFGLRTDLHLETSNRFSFSSSIFYMGFIAGAMPAILMAQRFPIERVAATVICIWGICLLCTIACHNYQGLYSQRFFLGFLESGISPMFMLIVTGFYKKNEQAMRIGVWFSANGFVSIVSPLVNWGLGHITTGPLHPWQYMYIVSGCLTILWALVVFVYMPPDPIRAKGFSERERFIAVSRLRVNNTGVRNTHFKIGQVKEAIMDIRFWLSFAMALLIMIANGPVSTFIAIVIGGFGFGPFESLLLVIPAGFIAGVEGLAVSYCAYKFPGWRTWLMIITLLPTITASALLWQLPRSNKGGLLVAIYMLGGFAAPYSVLMGIQTANTAGYTKKSVTSSGLFLGYCLGNIIGPLVFKPSDAPSYGPGFAVVLSTSVAAGVLALCYRYICVWENNRRDRTGVVEGYEHAYDDDLTDMKNPQFRYCL
ncbi:MFS transporter [Ilyonectria destructans]|nr:MFS transporter [Ilyonectria destructans]